MTHRIGIIAQPIDITLLTHVLALEGDIIALTDITSLTTRDVSGLDLLVVAPIREGTIDNASYNAVRMAISQHQVSVFSLLARGDAAAMEQAFSNGAADCAGYPIDPDEVRIRIRALLRRKDIDDRLRADAAEVQQMAHTDQVTGIWNRHYLDTDLAAKIAQAVASTRPLSLLMIDIDRFKPINDRHGHAIGDKVLRTIAARLSGGIRAIDTLARFGGDELVLVMPDTALTTAIMVAERLRGLVAEKTAEVPFDVTISIGVAELDLNEPATSLLAQADAALYRAKLDGRNRVVSAP